MNAESCSGVRRCCDDVDDSRAHSARAGCRAVPSRQGEEPKRGGQGCGPVWRLGTGRQTRWNRPKPQPVGHSRPESRKRRRYPLSAVARAKTLSEKTSTGADPRFDETTDPQVLYCEPPGVPHIYLWPIKTKFIQTPEAVYILHELGPYYRIVWLNSKHPADTDPQWWGHSIGRYENGNTLVVDTVGFNDKTWLDQMGHPHTEQLHLTERYKRVDENTLELDITIDDPGAYTKPWNAHRNFTLSKTGFLRYQQICSVRENQQFFDNLGKPAATPPVK